ncbi:hypothetical protein IPH19_00585 [Candidatus Uhrbacteria bacterium]|nr:MAG: hypothetical protein IPH19_00585 [Candidatus Uhrbacteria bacterium]
MTHDEWLEGFNAAPDAVQEYLLGPSSGTAEDAAQTRLAYDNDAWDRLMDAVWDLLFKKSSRGEFEAKLKIVAGDRKPEEVERVVLRWVVLPLADLVTWDVEARLLELGVPIGEIQGAVRVSLRPVSYGAAVRRIASTAKISLLNEEIVRKIRDVMVSVIKGVRSKEQALEILQRQQSEGGLGFAPQQAQAFIAEMETFLATTQVMSEQEYAEWYRNFQQQSNAEEAEAASAKQKSSGDELSGAGMPKPAVSTDPVLEAAIDSGMAQIGDLKLDEYTAKRLRNVVSTRLRDVRNAMQTRAMLERETHVGGVGLAPDVAARVAAIIESTYQTQHSAIDEEQRKRIESMQDEQRKKIDERKQRESEEHAAWYKQKVAGAKGDIAVEQLRAAMQGQVLVDSGQVSVQAKPSMIDIVPPMRLSGLGDELKSMDIETFRRQAKTPEQAAEKIYQKLETLKRENFERWTDGVAAWRSSPLQQQYLRLVTESFSTAKPVAQLVEEKRKIDPNLPTAEELGAIIALNARIQF